MPKTLKAFYQHGAFYPEEPCDLPEGAEVELVVQGPVVAPPTVTDPKERKAIMTALVDRMLATPLPEGAPRLTREALHERR